MTNHAADTHSPRIYVICLGCYNKVESDGCWIDATQDEQGMYADVFGMLAKCSAKHRIEEYKIFDYENFGLMKFDQYECIGSAACKAKQSKAKQSKAKQSKAY